MEVWFWLSVIARASFNFLEGTSPAVPVHTVLRTFLDTFAANEAEYAWQNAPNDNATMLVPFVGVTYKRNIILGQAVIDYVACLLFFLTCLIKRLRMARPLRKVHATTATVADYTVQITGVPQVCWFT